MDRSDATVAFSLLPLLILLIRSDAARSPCSENDGDKPRITQLLNLLFPLHANQKYGKFQYSVKIEAKFSDSNVLPICEKDGKLSQIKVTKTITTAIAQAQLTGNCRKRPLGGFLLGAQEKNTALTATHTIKGFVLRLDKSDDELPVKYSASGVSASITLQKDDAKASAEEKTCPLLEDKLAEDVVDQMFSSIAALRLLEMFTLCSKSTADAVEKALTETFRGAKVEFGETGDIVFKNADWAAPGKAFFSDGVSLTLDNLAVFCERTDAVSSIQYRPRSDASEDRTWLITAKGVIKPSEKSGLHCKDQTEGAFVLRMRPYFEARIDRTITVTLTDPYAISAFDASKGDVDSTCPAYKRSTRKEFEKAVRVAFNGEFEKLLDKATATAIGLIDCSGRTTESVYKALDGVGILMAFTSGKLSLPAADNNNFAVRCRPNNPDAIVQIKTRGLVNLKKIGVFGMSYTLHEKRDPLESPWEYRKGLEIRFEGSLRLRFDCAQQLAKVVTGGTTGARCDVDVDYGKADLIDYSTMTREKEYSLYSPIKRCYQRRLLSAVTLSLHEAVQSFLKVRTPENEIDTDQKCYHNAH